ncbi:MAG: tetratricopeptide repeat protein [Bacteroidales bacterium]|nr:tetratricopeptide repeat protein [Bacteroidales bacterium]
MIDKQFKAVVIAALLFSLGTALSLSGCKTKQKESSKDETTVAQDTTPAKDTVYSIADLTTMIRHDPLNASLFAQRAEAQATSSKFDEALNDISLAIRLDSLNPRYYVVQAEYFIYGGQPNSAKKGLNQCLKLFPNNTAVMLKLAEIHFYLKEYSQSKRILQNVMTIDDGIGQIYFLQGLILLENSDTVNAIRSLQVAIDKEPEFYDAYMMLGSVNAKLDNNLAIDYFRAAADIRPDSYEARYNLGIYLQDHDYTTEALNEYQYIIDNIDTTSANPYYNIGYLNLIYEQNFEKAIEFFTLAVEKEPDYVEAWYNRGFTYEVMGKLKKARADYEQSLTIKSNYPLSIKGINRIDKGKPFQYK